MSTKTTINISPKVLTGTLTGLGLAAVGGIAAAVTPATFGFLGVWAPGAFAVATILLGQASAWCKREHEQATEAPAPATLPATTPPDAPAPLVPPVPQPAEPAPTVDQIIAAPELAQTTTPDATPTQQTAQPTA